MKSGFDLFTNNVKKQIEDLNKVLPQIDKASGSPVKLPMKEILYKVQEEEEEEKDEEDYAEEMKEKE